ncbi:putative sensor domain DACNV-containing protein [Myxococcus xanthus]|uniref:putative sensor domain DACNV-containing protein n=1 Tax=Myxococcus xanthus TaxID=34 RepID=UPI0011294756|nr:diadenylate cyclase [Myxococcus xanthus]
MKAVEAELVDLSISNLPSSPEDAGGWARRVLKVLVPIAMRASLIKEEGHYPQFSIAVARRPLVAAWESVVLLEHLDVTADVLAKLSLLSKAGMTHLVAVEEDGGLKLLGFGQPPEVIRMRLPRSIASSVSRFDLYSYVVVTVLGPQSLLIEGFGTELAFLHEGRLRTPAELPEPLELGFIARTCRSDSLLVPSWIDDSMKPFELRASQSLELLEMLARGAWFGARGGIFAFAAHVKRRSNWGMASCRWIARPLPLLQSRLDYFKAILAFVPKRDSPIKYLETRQKEAQSDAAVAHAVRMSKLDGAVLMNEDFEVVAFGAKLRATKPKELLVRHARNGAALDLRQKGTRHLSAYSWVVATDGRMAMVVSQDREIRVFDRSVDGEVVYWDFRPPLFE